MLSFTFSVLAWCNKKKILFRFISFILGIFNDIFNVNELETIW
jgi:hypothetical protein